MSFARAILISCGVLAAALVLSVAIGPIDIPLGTLLSLLIGKMTGSVLAADVPETFATILFEIRLPHALLILLTGAALAGSGASYQGLFRNPLADPYLIGVASGAGLGAVIAMSIRWPADLLGLYVIPAAAFLGGLATVLIVYSLARYGKSLPTTTLILAGVAVSSFATSLTSFLMLRSNEELRRATGWLLGGSLMSGWQPVAAVLPYVLLGLTILITSGHALNVLQFGEEQASQMGLAAERVKFLLILAASLTAAAAVAFSGIIGFIGLIVPHLVRLLWGADYRRLIPLSIISTFIVMRAMGFTLNVLTLLARLLTAVIESRNPADLRSRVGDQPELLLEQLVASGRSKPEVV